MKMMWIGALACLLLGNTLLTEVSRATPDSISTPNEVEIFIGTLKFLEGAPIPETAEKVLKTNASKRFPSKAGS